jgi:heat shock protein HslJ
MNTKPTTKTRAFRTLIGLGLTPLGLAVAMTACGGPRTNPGAATEPLPGAVDGGAAPQSSAVLLGTWRALSLEPAGQPRVVVAEPARFTAEFHSDGTLSLLADCNRCSGGYSAAAGLIRTTPMACTRAYCSSAPLDTQFTQLVDSATTWTVSGDRLELSSDAGVARLQR